MKQVRTHDFHEAILRMALENLKREFRKWYSAISVKEFAVNPKLMAEIVRLEKALEAPGG